MAEKTSQGLNLYDYMTDKNRDIYEGTFGKTDGTNPSSMEVINDFMENKIKLDGDSKQNFNFTENKVVQDGLLYSCIDRKKSYNTFKQIDVWCLNFSANVKNFYSMSEDGVFYIFGQGINMYINGVGSIGFVANNGNIIIDNIYTGISPSIPFNLTVYRNKNRLSIYINNKLFEYDCSQAISNNLVIGHYAVDNFDNVGKWDGYFSAEVYDHLLLPQEIQHNLSVINNAKSLKTIDVTDTTNGKTSILSFGADGNHVEMKTGRTLEEEYMGVLEGMSQEYTSTGSAITVNDGLKARLVGATIEGQTVKNYCNYLQSITLSKILTVNTINTITFDTTKQYSFLIDVTRIVGTPVIQLADTGGVGIVNSRITAKIGLNKVVFTPTATQVNRIGMATTATSDAECDFKIVGVFDGDANVSSQVPFGLSSTVATITNNGIKYPFYSLDEQGNKKQISLGKVDTVADKLTLNSDGSLSVVISTHRVKLNDCLFTKTSDIKTNTTRWNTKGIAIEKLFDVNINCDKIKTVVGGAIVNVDEICVGKVYSNNVFNLRTPNTLTTSDEVKQWLNATYGDVLIESQLATPTTTTIQKEVNAPVLTNQSNILQAGEAVLPSSFSVKIPTTSQIKKQYAQTLLNSYTGTASANLLKDGRVQLDMTVTIPTTFNQTVFSLPPELRPKVARKVMGFNGNNPATLIVGTDGTVKIPTAITGTVELCDEYVL